MRQGRRAAGSVAGQAGHPLADAPGYAEGGRLWLAQADQPSAVPAVFLHGARFFRLNDKPRAEQLLREGLARFGEDAAWDGPLGYLYLEKSLVAHTTDVGWRMGRQREPAKLANQLGEDARAQSHASELLALAQRHPGDEKYGAALHDGHMVLGRLALKRKSVAEARAHLLEAGRTVGGGTLSSFGPNMGLAKDLLDQGERQVVIEYLRLCKNFWTGPNPPVDAWIAEIEAGRKPNFGANLDY